MLQDDEQKQQKLIDIYRDAASLQKTFGLVTVELLDPSEDALDKVAETFIEKTSDSSERYINELEKITTDYKFLPSGRDDLTGVRNSEILLDKARGIALEKMIKDHAARFGSEGPVIYLLGIKNFNREDLHNPEMQKEIEEYVQENGIKKPIRLVVLSDNANKVWLDGKRAMTGNDPTITEMILFTARGEVVGSIDNTDDKKEFNKQIEDFYREAFSHYRQRQVQPPETALPSFSVILPKDFKMTP